MKFQNPKRTVVSVDDDEVNQLVISSFLEGAGYNVIQCADGESCLEYLKKAFAEEGEIKAAFPDILLLDVVMPGMDGYQVCREVRRRFPATFPVIMISAKMSKEDVIHGLTFGIANDYMTKPFDRAILLAKIEARLAVSDSVRALAAHRREEFCQEMYKPAFEPVSAEPVGAVLVVLHGTVNDKQIKAVVDGMTAWLQEKGITLRELQFGQCLLTSPNCDELMEFCCTIFGSAEGPDAITRSAICFLMNPHGYGIIDVMRLALRQVPSGAVQATSDFYERLDHKTVTKYFSTRAAPPGSLAAESIQPLTLLPPLEGLLSHIRGELEGPIDQVLISECSRSVEIIDRYFSLSRPDALDQTANIRERHGDAKAKLEVLNASIKCLRQLSQPGLTTAERTFTTDQWRYALLKLLSQWEGRLADVTGGVAFEDVNMDVLQFRLTKAERFKTDFTRKLGLVDDVVSSQI